MEKALAGLCFPVPAALPSTIRRPLENPEFAAGLVLLFGLAFGALGGLGAFFCIGRGILCGF